MKSLLSHLVSAGVGLWLSSMLVPGVVVRVLEDSTFFGIPLTADWMVILVLGVVLGLLNFSLKPILAAITLPLRILTLGLFSLIINMGLIWIADAMFDELTIPLILPLLYTSLIIWGIHFVLAFIIKDHP